MYSCLYFVLFWNCKKRSHDTRSDDFIQIKLSTEGLAYVQLGLGKYFIYKDSASAQLDSVIVTKSILKNLYTPGFNGGVFASSPPFYSEVFSLTLTKIDGGIQTIWFEAETDSPSIYAYSSMDNQPISMFYMSFLSFAYALSSALTNLTVEGKVYNSVIQTIGDNGAELSSPDYISVVTYWAKGVGIIKRTRTDSLGTKTYKSY